MLAIDTNPETRADILSANREYLVAYLTDQGFQCYDYENAECLRTAALDHWDTENPKTEFKFMELPESAKEHAKQQYALHDDWYEDTLDNYKNDEVLKAQGFGIEEIHFSGFYSQGDGACWQGYVQLPEFIEHFYTSDADAVIREAMLALIFDGFMEPRVKISASGFYSHSGTMRIPEGPTLYDTAEDDDIIPQTYAGVFAGANVKQLYDLAVHQLDDLETRVTVEARELADRIYEALEEEHDWYFEDESFKDTADANDWKFDESGVLV